MSSLPIPAPHATLGALFIGVMLANSLHGISIVQTFYYYRHQKDVKPLKILVAIVMVFDTIHQGIITHTVYTYLVSNWGNVDVLSSVVPSLIIQNFFNALTALTVQSFLTARVWKLSDGNILLTGLLTLFVLAEFFSVIVFNILGIQCKTVTQLLVLKPLSLAVNVLSAVGDVLIAASLCILLHRFRTGFQRSDTMINKLMMFALNTGLLTSLCAVASFISYMALPNSFLYITFYFCIGRLYTNSFLATLNARKMIGGSPDVPMSSFKVPKSGASSGFSFRPRGTGHLPIKIEATTECTTDSMQDQKQVYEGDKTEYSSSNVAVGIDKKDLGV